MLTKTKKILVGFLSFSTLLVIAGCQPSPSQSSQTNEVSQTNETSQTTNAPQDLTQDQQGTWEWTDQQMTIQKVFLATDIKKLALVLMLDDFDNVKMTMSIKDNTVELKYRFDYKELYKDFAYATGVKKGDFESYLNSLTGEIDTKKHTITFPETPAFLDTIVMGTTFNLLVPITYTYTVEGNQITLYAEGKDELGRFKVMRLRFNYVGDNN